ncbi:unnamed protein product [Paramecium primaurelia]|uniref:Uncharacterized protein n=1 Tax=Paramecium primaurelia TaxID=5886 RepID=A0A8S1NPR2_PARPR|nr:unnamed protein product [Paramecium primaurelia]
MVQKKCISQKYEYYLIDKLGSGSFAQVGMGKIYQQMKQLQLMQSKNLFCLNMMKASIKYNQKLKYSKNQLISQNKQFFLLLIEYMNLQKLLITFILFWSSAIKEIQKQKKIEQREAI